MLHERTIFDNGKWIITISRITEDFISGLVISNCNDTVYYGVYDSFIRCNDDIVRYDYPSRIPGYIKQKLSSMLDKKQLTCVVCNKTIDMTKPYNEPKSIDTIYPGLTYTRL